MPKEMPLRSPIPNEHYSKFRAANARNMCTAPKSNCGHVCTYKAIIECGKAIVGSAWQRNFRRGDAYTQ